jgi:hypothetical protein
MVSEVTYKCLHSITAIVAAIICYIAIHTSFQSTNGHKLRADTSNSNNSIFSGIGGNSNNKIGNEEITLANGFKIRQGFCIGIAVSNMIRLFCEILMLYLELGVTHEDDETVDAGYVTSQLLPSQFYALMFSYLAAYFIYLKYSLIGYSCMYMPVFWFALIIVYFVLLIFAVVLTPDGTYVFLFVSVYDIITLGALCWYGFGILAFISAGNVSSLQTNRVIGRFTPLLYVSCINIACAGIYNLTLYVYPAAK